MVEPQSKPAGTWFGLPAATFRRLSREGMAVVLGRGALAVIGLLGLRITTGLADRSVLGEASLLMGAVALGTNLFLVPVANVQQRFHPDYAARSQLRAFTTVVSRHMLKHGLLLVATGIPVYALWRWQSSGGMRPWLVLALLALVAVDVVRSVPMNTLGAERQQARFSIWQVSSALLAFGLGAAGLLAASLIGRLYTEFYLLGFGLGGLIVAACLRRPWSGIPREGQDVPLVDGAREDLAKAKAYGAPFIALSVVSWAMSLGDRFVLGALMDIQTVGTYVAAYSIASRAVIMPHGILVSIARPILYQAEGRNDRERGQRVYIVWLTAVIVLSGALCAFLWLAGPLLVGLLLDARYRAGATELMVWVAVGHSLLGIAQVVEVRLMSFGASRSLLLPSVVGAVFNVAATALLIPRFGAVGAAAGTAAAYGLHCVLAGLTLTRVAKARVAA